MQSQAKCIADLKKILLGSLDKKEELYEKFISSKTIQFVKSTYDLRGLLALFPDKKEEIFEKYILLNEFDDVLNGSIDLNDLRGIFPDKEEELYKKYILSNNFDHKLALDVYDLSILLRVFPSKKEELYKKYVISNQFDNKLLNDVYSFCNVAQMFPDKKEELYCNLIISGDFGNKLISVDDFLQLLNIFPGKKESLFDKYIVGKRLSGSRLNDDYNLNLLLESFPNEKHQRIILESYFGCRSINCKLLSSLIVPPQYGPTCGFNALSAITKCFYHETNHRFLFYPVESSKDGSNNGLRKIGKKIGIYGPGGIYSLRLFRELIREINLYGEVIHINTEQKFSEVICKLIDHSVPIILPYDRVNNGGNNAHYAVICGYLTDKTGYLNLIITHHGKYEIIPSTLLYSLNSDLNFLNKEKGCHAKINKSENYKNITQDQMATQKFYKTYQYPSMKLDETLKNRLLMVMTHDMLSKLKQTDLFQELKQFIEDSPKDPEVVNSPSIF